jgi:hypothetical protein
MSPIANVRPEPSAGPITQQKPKMGALGFLAVFFGLFFIFSLLALSIGVGTFMAATSSYMADSEDLAISLGLAIGGLTGSLLAGIGWSICIIAERLAKRGLL